MNFFVVGMERKIHGSNSEAFQFFYEFKIRKKYPVGLKGLFESFFIPVLQNLKQVGMDGKISSFIYNPLY